MRIKLLQIILLLTVVIGLLMPSQAFAGFTYCVILDITAWTSAQRGYLSHVIAVAIAGVRIKKSSPDVQSIKICAEQDLPALDSSALQAQAQIAVDAYVSEDAARLVELDDARTEVQGNNLCTATPAEVENRLDAIHTAIQNSIDLIDATGTAAKVRAALTLENTRRTAIDKQLARCVLSRARLQRNREN